MGPKLANAIGLYIDGVRDGNLDAAVDKYIAEGLVQHSPGIPAGRAGLARALEPLVERYSDRLVLILRGFEDGSKVFLHTFHRYGHRSVEQVRMDIFDTDGQDCLVEHWGVRTPLVSWSRSGCSQIDGVRRVTDTAATAANKELVRGYLTDVLIAGDRARLDDYVSDRTFIQHDPDVSHGIAALRTHLDRLAAGGLPRRYLAVEQLVGAGNFVAAYGDAAVGRLRYAVGDLFRVDSGRIVEHWVVTEAMPPTDD